jgi:hypothetical protein
MATVKARVGQLERMAGRDGPPWPLQVLHYHADAPQSKATCELKAAELERQRLEGGYSEEGPTAVVLRVVREE